MAEIKESLFFYLSPETVSKTNSQYWQSGQIVNLERSLKVSDRLDGHLVSGHVDGTLTVIDIISHGEAFKVVFKLASHEELRLIYPKGSIAIDGISLTINDIQDDRFSVMIIPHTWTHTNAQFWQCGQKVHVEFDSMAKMIDHQLRIREKMAIEFALKSFKEGKPIIVFDNESRENEGDIILPAQLVTPEIINWITIHARG